ncbi:MAG: hypothetical protein OHK93_001251 [Ramalina farinacea]|uniref:Uncharacterized protein n=1 Tax=Ramalina farinacea TaxID=258253 RepID=A0AA43TZB0_9LECA|nr:hypothetical protein [Ramalina farinacea]
MDKLPLYAEKQPLPGGHAVVIEGDARSSTILKRLGTFTSTVLFVACIFLLGQRVAEYRHNIFPSSPAGFRHAKPDNGQPLVGVGIDLTVDYGTISISYGANTQSLAKVDGSNEYKALMARAFQDNTPNSSNPHQKAAESSPEKAREVMRPLGKQRVSLVTSDILILAEMIDSLMAYQHDFNARSAVLSAPNLPGLLYEDIKEAFDLLGLQLLDTRLHHDPLTGKSASTHAGHGFGLCSDPESLDGCLAEASSSLPTEHIMIVEWTQNALTARRTYIGGFSTVVDPSSDQQIQDFTLGSDNAVVGQPYWSKVRAQIGRLLDQEPYATKPLTKVILVGESIEHDSFLQRLLQDVLKEAKVGEKMPDFLVDDPVFVVSKGAAEMARQARYDS